MGFNYDEVSAKRAAVPEIYRVSEQAGLGVSSLFDLTRRAEIEAEASGARKAVDDDIAFVEIDGERAVVEGPQTEAERRNAKARLISDRNDADALAEKAGILVSGIETTGLGSKETAKKQQIAANREAEKEARKQALMALQAYLDGLQDKYDDLTDRINALVEARSDLAAGVPLSEILDRPKIKDAIKDWEDRTGRKFDPNSPDAHATLDQILKDQHDHYRIDRDKIKNDIDELAPLLKEAKENPEAIRQAEIDTFNGALQMLKDEVERREAMLVRVEEMTEQDVDISVELHKNGLQTTSRFADQAPAEETGSSFSMSFSPMELDSAAKMTDEFQKKASAESEDNVVAKNEQGFNFKFNPTS